MSGQMMNYKRYMESLENTPEPSDDSGNIVIDYTAMIEYASKKNVEPCDLSEEEKKLFIIREKEVV